MLFSVRCSKRARSDAHSLFYEEGLSSCVVKHGPSLCLQIQQQLHTTYKSLQHRVADALPVTFELEDPEEIKRAHKERRAQLLKVSSVTGGPPRRCVTFCCSSILPV